MANNVKKRSVSVSDGTSTIPGLNQLVFQSGNEQPIRDLGGGKVGVRIVWVSNVAPTSPRTNDLWVDTS